MKSIFTLFLILTGFFSYCQGALNSVNGWNVYVATPSDYATSGKSYPTIVFFPGLGEVGSVPANAYKYGTNAYVKQGWKGDISVDGKTTNFIVVTIQPSAVYPSEDAVEVRMKWLKSNYRVDIKNIFLTGLSMGGGVAGAQVSTGTYYKEVKAIATYCGMLNDWNGGKPFSHFDNFALNGGKYLCIEQKNDIRYNEQVVTRMNTVKTGSAFYVTTSFGAAGHGNWDDCFGGNGTQPKPVIDGLTIYQWIARQVTGTATTPPVIIPPVTTYSQSYVDSLTKAKDQIIASKDASIKTLNESVTNLNNLLSAANGTIAVMKPEYERILAILNNIILQICNK